MEGDVNTLIANPGFRTAFVGSNLIRHICTD